MSLASVQRRMAEALASGDVISVADLFDTKLRPPQAGLSLYRHSMLAGLVDVLAKRFPEARLRLRDEAFFAAAEDFARRHPPHSPYLSEFGREFLDYVSSGERAGT